MVLPSVGVQFSSFSIHKRLRTQATTSYLKPSLSNSIINMSFSKNTNRKLPILLFDIMDTIVHDPFYKEVPAFFEMSFNELMDSIHKTAWIDFEKGLIDEMELARILFKDGRDLDLEGKRKPDTEFYMKVLRHLKIDPAYCIFIDDRPKNVEAAAEVGIKGVHFKNVELLREDLSLMGIEISTYEAQ